MEHVRSDPKKWEWRRYKGGEDYVMWYAVAAGFTRLSAVENKRSELFISVHVCTPTNIFFVMDKRIYCYTVLVIECSWFSRIYVRFFTFQNADTWSSFTHIVHNCMLNILLYFNLVKFWLLQLYIVTYLLSFHLIIFWN